jgi:hypothetical protein
MPEKENKEVWVACRASAKCQGKKAIILSVIEPVYLNKGVPIACGGGRTIRYQCTTCNQVFNVGQ